MEMDYGQFGMVAGVLVFPDWVFPDTPKSPSDVREIISIGGSSSRAQLNITGSADSID